MTEINDEEFIHAIFGQLSSTKCMYDRLQEDFNVKNIKKDGEMLKLCKISPIIVIEELEPSKSLKKRKKVKKNLSAKKK